MRTIIPSILLLILLSFTSPAPSELAKRIGRILIEIIELKKEYELRKLQGTDSTDDEVNYIEPSTNNTKAYIYNFLISMDLLKLLLQMEKLLFLLIPYFISLEFQSQM